MEQTSSSTLERSHLAAKAEFLEKGYQAASLRNIVKNAGVTTGAFYGYYDSKEALFAALVDESYQYLMDTYRKSTTEFERLSAGQQTMQMERSVGKSCMQELLVYMMAHRDAFHLILLCSEGTPYATLIDDLVTLEATATERYCEMLRHSGKQVPIIDKRLEHILLTGMLSTYFEMIIHDISLEDAARYLVELNAFYTAGWLKIMGQ